MIFFQTRPTVPPPSKPAMCVVGGGVSQYQFKIDCLFCGIFIVRHSHFLLYSVDDKHAILNYVPCVYTTPFFGLLNIFQIFLYKKKVILVEIKKFQKMSPFREISHNFRKIINRGGVGPPLPPLMDNPEGLILLFL